ncbi:NAD-dependent dihydropyrimidine dehydrogenase subunit PreA [Anaerosporobacter faecicola]|uniref:NAD-dependent dihydropyrimidine dehydrogenase subunit PreA n=1 Tax=Anaerosporobacter faecicola TaxID=2718714 RepID=UPI00143A6D6C|nr:NAD-dependent dihydropyrimidine dehydrogenase subunit PreA [Anaerosporobacter faecicola]
MVVIDRKISTLTNACFLCEDPTCTKACRKQLDPARVIRALRFENMQGARAQITEESTCETCEEKACMSACVRSQYDHPVAIDEIMKATKLLPVQEDMQKIDLTTQICGVTCENPFFLSSSVVGSNYEMVAKAFDMGFAGVAFKTVGMFVPKEVSPRFSQIEKEGEKFVGFKNIEQISDHTLEENLGFFRRLKKEYPSKIIIASIMGRTEEEWTKLATLVEEAGADIIECNFSCPHMSGSGLGSDVGTNPELVHLYTKATKKGTTLPVLAKMTPNITNMEVPARAAVEAGADGLAAINTIKSIMNVNLDTFVSAPEVVGSSSVGGYSGKAVKPIALRFIHDMKVDPMLKEIPISGMGGITTWRDALEFIAMGCSTVQITTSVMEYGYRIIDDLLDGLSRYMAEHKLGKIDEILGKALPTVVAAESLDRDSICYPKFDRKRCIGCDRCVVSCYDGGHQALSAGNDRKPVMDAKKCVGCHLCTTVCPVDAISMGARVRKVK